MKKGDQRKKQEEEEEEEQEASIDAILWKRDVVTAQNRQLKEKVNQRGRQWSGFDCRYDGLWLCFG